MKMEHGMFYARFVNPDRILKIGMDGRKLLEKIEYVIEYGTQKRYCPLCEELEEKGHLKDCLLKQVKQELEKELDEIEELARRNYEAEKNKEILDIPETKVQIPEFLRHHPFCNYYTKPRDGCWQCEEMFRKYPMQEGETGADLLKKHFPEQVKNP
jgi:hypothetical protein